MRRVLLAGLGGFLICLSAISGHAQSKPDLATVDPSTPTAETQSGAPLAGEARQKYDALLPLVEDARNTTNVVGHRKLLREFMVRSAELLVLAPEQTNIWVARGAAALELDYPGDGWLVGQKLADYGGTNCADPEIREMAVAIARRGWLGRTRLSRDWKRWKSDRIMAAANDGDVEAQGALAYWYRHGTPAFKQDYSESVKWCRLAAERMDANGLYGLGAMYQSGLGVETNYPAAAGCYRKAAALNDFRAQLSLGRMCETGRGVGTNFVEAAKWYRRAAAHGVPDAQYRLGSLYETGRGVETNFVEAAKWFRQAAEVGQSDAQGNLGVLYEFGLGVKRDYAEALKWLGESARQGNPGGQVQLGRIYELGRGVDKDEAEAVKWYRQAAERGYPGGQYQLGEMYENGRGVDKDLAMAINWYREAASRGNSEAKVALERLQVVPYLERRRERK